MNSRDRFLQSLSTNEWDNVELSYGVAHSQEISNATYRKLQGTAQIIGWARDSYRTDDWVVDLRTVTITASVEGFVVKDGQLEKDTHKISVTFIDHNGALLHDEWVPQEIGGLIRRVEKLGKLNRSKLETDFSNTIILQKCVEAKLSAEKVDFEKRQAHIIAELMERFGLSAEDISFIVKQGRELESLRWNAEAKTNGIAKAEEQRVKAERLLSELNQQ